MSPDLESAESEIGHMVMHKTSTVHGSARRGIRAVLASDMVLHHMAVHGQVHQTRREAMRLTKLWVWNARLGTNFLTLAFLTLTIKP